MMLKFIIIGLMCNSQGCYWVQVEDKPTIYDDYKACITKATDYRVHSIMYHSMGCMVKND